MTTIPIFFTFDDRYALPALLTFNSLLRHANTQHCYALHVLHFGLSKKWQSRLLQVVARFPNARLEFTDCSELEGVRNLGKEKSHFSKEIFLKLTAASRFPQYERILCSDVDVLFLDDIAPSFFAFEGERFVYAGVDTILPTQRMKGYVGFSEDEQRLLREEIAAGYLLFNLTEIRRSNVEQLWTQYYLNHYERLQFPEQDCMALCAGRQSKTLGMEYLVCNNFYTIDARSCSFYEHNRCLPQQADKRRAAFVAALEHPVQLHYVGANKPWNAINVPRQRLWFAELRAAGAELFYLEMLPSIARQQIGRYSLRRFVKKLIHRFAR